MRSAWPPVAMELHSRHVVPPRDARHPEGRFKAPTAVASYTMLVKSERREGRQNGMARGRANLCRRPQRRRADRSRMGHVPGPNEEATRGSRGAGADTLVGRWSHESSATKAAVSGGRSPAAGGHSHGIRSAHARDQHCTSLVQWERQGVRGASAGGRLLSPRVFRVRGCCGSDVPGEAGTRVDAQGASARLMHRRSSLT